MFLKVQILKVNHSAYLFYMQILEPLFRFTKSKSLDDGKISFLKCVPDDFDVDKGLRITDTGVPRILSWNFSLHSPC